MRALVPIAMLALLLCGCAGPQARLSSEDDVPELAALKCAADAQPLRMYRLPTRIDDGPIVRVAVHVAGPDEPSRTFVLIHGCLSDQACWRFVRGNLGGDVRVVLVDLPGCGDSDKPSARRLGPTGYSPDELAERLLQALDSALEHDEREGPITIVGHSLGGTIAMRMLGDTGLRNGHPSIVRRVDRLVLLSPADLDMPNPPQIFVKIAGTSPAEFAVADLFGILRGQITVGTRAAADDPTRAVREEAHRLYDILRRPETRSAAQAILRQSLPRRGGRPDWRAVARLQADYANVAVPCLILWGAHDETLPVAGGYKLAAMLPAATLVVVPDCMHSIHLEQPARCARLVREFSSDPVAFAARVDDPIP